MPRGVPAERRYDQLTRSQIEQIKALLEQHGFFDAGRYYYKPYENDSTIAERVGVSKYQVRSIRQVTRGRLRRGKDGAYGPVAQDEYEMIRVNVNPANVTLRRRVYTRKSKPDQARLALPPPTPFTELWTSVRYGLDSQIDALDVLMKQVANTLALLTREGDHQ